MKNIVLSIIFLLVSFFSFSQQPTISLFDLPVQDATNYADAYDYWFPDNDTVTVMPVLTRWVQWLRRSRVSRSKSIWIN